MRIKFNHQTVSYSRRVLPACACSYLHDSIRASLPCGNGNANANANVNTCCRGDQYASAEADTGATPAATSTLTNPHAYADIYVDGNSNDNAISHSYSHSPPNGHTGTTSSSAGDVYWR